MNKFVVQTSFTRHNACEFVVVDAKGFQSPISNRVVTLGQSSSELVVVEMQVTKFHKLFPKIYWKGSGKVVAPDVKIDHKAQPHALWKRPRQLVAVNIEIFCVIKK